MFVKYVWLDLIRNPRRTLSTAILFFVDGLSASMTQRAVAPLPIDMQRVLTTPVAGDIRLALRVEPAGPAKTGDLIQVRLTLTNHGNTPANEVIVRSVPGNSLAYKHGSARIDGRPVPSAETENPFASGPAKIGLNIGTVDPGATTVFEYQVIVDAARDVNEHVFRSSFSTREAFLPVAANRDEPMALDELVSRIEAIEGVAFAEQLSFVDLPAEALSRKSRDGVTFVRLDSQARVFGFDQGYMDHDHTIRTVTGEQRAGEAMISAEAADALSVEQGDSVLLSLPDGSQWNTRISGILDLSRARSLFSSRRGAIFETFVYVPNSLLVDSRTYSEIIVPAYEEAASGRGERVKSPPVREVDIGIERELLDGEPTVALEQTRRIAAAIAAVSPGQDFLLDNISNSLEVARDDAVVAKRMFVFLGLPGAMLAAMLAAYAGIVLSCAQRREKATLRIRGASRRHLLSMLSIRVSCITVAGAAIGVVLGFASAAMVLGYDSLMRATNSSLLISALLGTGAGLIATGSALYITGRRSIDREINDDRARLQSRPPAWRRYYLDFAAMLAVLIATVIVLANSGFKGSPGSVYLGQAVELSLGLLFLPIGAWIAGSLFGARLFAHILSRQSTDSHSLLDLPLPLLVRMSLRRRTWVLADAVVILGLIVALGTSLAIFTVSYSVAKAADARYLTGSDIRITPRPAHGRVFSSTDTDGFVIEGINAAAPVIYGVHNVVLHSKRTEELSTLAALDPKAFLRVAPLEDMHFSNGGAAKSLNLLAERPDAILLSSDMAAFLKARMGDTIGVLLARATPEQVIIELQLVGTFERLPGFPDGVDALIDIRRHEAMVISSAPAFFLANANQPSDAATELAAKMLRNGPGADGTLRVDTRLNALARDQSSLAALNIDGLLKLDSSYSLAMGTVTMAIFVFGLLLQRRREYVTLRAQGMRPRTIRVFIGAEATTVAVAGCVIGIPVGMIMAFFLINVLRPLFVLDPPYILPLGSLVAITGSVLAATLITVVAASSLVNRLSATELLRDE